MNKCPRCKTEFAGKFCPECGYKWADEKTCPKCGTKTTGSARFCEECGYSFARENNDANSWLSQERNNTPIEKKQISQPSTQKIPSGNRASTLYSVVKTMPVILMAVFAILMLIFFSVNVAVMPGATVMGIPVPESPYGSIYGECLDNLPEITGIVIALIIFTVIVVLYALLCIVLSVLHKTKNSRVLFLGKYDILLSEMFTILSPILFAVFVVLSGVLMGKLSNLDGGSGLIEIGAYPILLLVFSIIFFVLSLCTSIVRLAKYEVFLVNGGGMSPARKAELAEFYSTHEPPKLGKTYSKKGLTIYNFDKHRYDNGKEGKTSSAVIWLSLNKTKIAVVAVVIAIVVTLLSTLIPYFTNIFRTSKVEEIKLGMSAEEVVDILGEPYDKKEMNKSSSGDIFLGGGNGIIDSVGNGNSVLDMTVTRWRYFDNEYAKMRKDAEMQLEGLGLKGGIDAILSGGLGGLTGIASSMATVITPLFNKTYDYIQVEFDKDGKVVRAILEKSRCDGISKKNRSVENMNYRQEQDVLGSHGNNIEVYYYEDLSASANKYTIVTDPVNETVRVQTWYTAYFNGGSLIRGYIEKIDSVEISGNTATATWKDDYAKYSAKVATRKIGYVNKQHEWISENIKLFKEINFLPESVTSIGEGAFQGCSNLVSITIPNSVTSIGYRAFDGCNKIIQTENGVQYVDKWVIDCNSSLTSVTLRAYTVGIGNNAFAGCNSLTSITIPNSVTSIGNSAFYYCSSLTSIVIPNSVTSIGNSAFFGCNSLTSITIPNSVTNIENSAFYYCSSLTSIVIPNSATSIGRSAFCGCYNLTSITIPNSVTSIGSEAFNGCINLTNIRFNGTKEQWKAISKGNYWNLGTGNYTVVCTDGTLS